MEIINIEGTVDIKTKELRFDIIRPVVSGENRTAQLKIAVPENLQAEDIYLEFKLPDKSRYVSPKLDITEGYAMHKLLNICLAKSGHLAIQLTAVKFAGEDTEVFKSKINTQISVSEGINAGEQIIESNPDIIAEVQNAINETLEVKNQLLEDKENDVFKGEKGDEGIVDYSITVTEYTDTNLYGLNSYCSYNGKLYKSLQADNTGNNPQTETDFWEEAYYDKDFIDNAFNNAATAEQGTKADNAVPSTRKINNKELSEDIILTPSDIGAATSEQGTKADSALQTETDPTVPSWAKEISKPSYDFNEISGILSGLQISDSFINAGKNINAVRDGDTGNLTLSAEIPLTYTCNGVNDNEEITNIVKEFYNSATLSNNANLKLTIIGKLGITNYKLYGDGSYDDNYRTFELGVNGYTGNRKVIIDWGGAEIPELNFDDGTTWSRLILIGNCDTPITMINLNVKITRTSNGYVYCCKGDNFNLYDCDIHVYNTAQGVSTAIAGNEVYLQNCKFYNYGGAQYTNNTIDGDNATIINCKFETIERSVYPINCEGAFVQGCHITAEGTSTVQVQCNSKDNCTFFNCILEISGKGTLRCNSGENCNFINCTLLANSTDSNSAVSANQGSSCYFLNCKLTATGNYFSSSGVKGNSASNCLFMGCILSAVNNRVNGYAYGANVWRGVMIGCELSAYVPEGGTGQAVGFFLNSSASNNCIINGCKFIDNPPSGYEQNASIIIDGTDTGGRYMITNNFISGSIITHTATGGNYIKEPNITGGTF